MKSKNLISLLIILILLIVLGVITFLNLAPLQNKPISVPENINIQNKQITDNTKPLSIQINYPYIAGQDDFNAKVENIVNKELNNFKSNSLENDNAFKQTDPVSYEKYPMLYYLSIGYDTGEVDNNVISVVFNIENYEGGAHGAHYSASLNYSIKNKKEIKLADLFPSQPNYLQKISDYCIKDLTKKIDQGMQDSAWILEGAGPKEENFSVFLVNKNSLTFYFGDYQVAPYAAGDYKVIMPR